MGKDKWDGERVLRREREKNWCTITSGLTVCLLWKWQTIPFWKVEEGSSEPHVLTKKTHFQQILSPWTERMLIQNNYFSISLTSRSFPLLLFWKGPGARVDRNIALLLQTNAHSSARIHLHPHNLFGLFWGGICDTFNHIQKKNNNILDTKQFFITVWQRKRERHIFKSCNL